MQGARIAGADPIIAVDVRAEKLTLAQVVGATHAVCSGEEDPVAAIRALTGSGVDIAFEAVGRQESIRQAWGSLGIGGDAILVGLLRHGEQLMIDGGPFIEEKSIRGCYFGSSHLAEDVPALVRRYLAGELLLDQIISCRIGLADLNDAFDRLREGQEARQVLVFDR